MSFLFAAVPAIAQTEVNENTGPNLQDAFSGMTQSVAERAGYETGESADLYSNVSNIISIFLSVIGIIFIALLILGGFNYMTAGGQEEKVNQAKKTIKQAILGIVIVFGAYVISYFIVSILSSLAN